MLSRTKSLHITVNYHIYTYLYLLSWLHVWNNRTQIIPNVYLPNIIVTQSTFDIIARYNKLGSIIQYEIQEEHA